MWGRGEGEDEGGGGGEGEDEGGGGGRGRMKVGEKTCGKCHSNHVNCLPAS